MVLIFMRITQTKDRRYRSNDNHVITLKQRTGSAMPQFINLIINGTVFFNISVRARHIGFRLVIIVIRHEVLNRVMWEKLLKLTIQLTSQRFIMR